MSIMPRMGKCLHCGHDHGNGFGDERLMDAIKRIAELEALLAAGASEGQAEPVAEIIKSSLTYPTGEKVGMTAAYVLDAGKQLPEGTKLYTRPSAEIKASDGHAEPVAWLHTMHMEGGQTDERLSFSDENPWGEPGLNYSEEYAVVSKPLNHPSAEIAALREQIAKQEIDILENDELIDALRERIAGMEKDAQANGFESLSDAIACASINKRDADRWRAFRGRDRLQGADADQFINRFEEEADAVIDAAINRGNK